jgi:hypothetical protein
MSARRWAMATALAGAAALGVLIAFSLLPQVLAAKGCGAGASATTLNFELARDTADIARIFGPAASRCRGLTVASMDAVNHLDVFAFIPSYVAFMVCAAFFAARARWSALVAGALAVAAVTLAGDYLETVSLLSITKRLDKAGDLVPYSHAGAWIKFCGLTAHSLLIAAIAFTAKPRRWALSILPLCAAPPLALTGLNQAAYAPLLNAGYALSWLPILALAIKESVSSDHTRTMTTASPA